MRHDFSCVTIVGDSGVGKTSLYVQINTNRFFNKFFAKFVGVYLIPNQIPWYFFDVSSNKEYRNAVYEKADLIIICISVTNRNHLKPNHPASISKWYKEIRQYSNKPILLVGNMIDLRFGEDFVKTSHRLFKFGSIFQKEGFAAALKIGACWYLECSCKTGEGIEGLMNFIQRFLFVKNNSLFLQQSNNLSFFSFESVISQFYHQQKLEYIFHIKIFLKKITIQINLKGFNALKLWYWYFLHKYNDEDINIVSRTAFLY